MATAPAKPCTTCHRQHCTQHVKRWDPKYRGTRGYNTTEWRRLSAQVMAEEPNCAACGLPGRHDDAADHIIERKDGGQDVRSNLQRMHRGCHTAKTTRERAKRARVAA